MSQLPTDPRKVPGIKIPFFTIDKPLPEGLRCVRVYIPDDDAFLRQLDGLIYQTTRWYNYSRDESHMGAALAKLWLKAMQHPKWLGACCMCMDCGELVECLTPLFEAIQASIDALLEEVEEGNNALKVTTPEPITLPNCGENRDSVYAGCVAAVSYVGGIIQAIYDRAEGELPDDLLEWGKVLIAAFPGLGSLPFDELYGMANDYFENQRETYEDAFNNGDFKMLAACRLFCMIDFNACTIDVNVIGNWLKGCDELIDGNVAGIQFAKFGDATNPTLLNQIGSFLNSIRGGVSLKQMYDDILTAYGFGAQGTDAGWSNCDCLTWTDDNIFSEGAGTWEVRQEPVTENQSEAGVYNEAGYWESSLAPDTYFSISISKATIMPYTGYMTAHVEYEYLVAADQNTMQWRKAPYDEPSGGGMDAGALVIGTGTWEATVTCEAADFVRIFVGSAVGSGAGNLRISRITLFGQGLNPFEL